MKAKNDGTEGKKPRVIIVGAGFGGLSAASELGRHAKNEVDVLLLDRNNYHGFWPLLYQVATAGLEPESVASPVRAIVRKFRNVRYERAEVKGVDWDRREVMTDGAREPFDYLIVSAGSANNYFGNDALARETYGLKDVDEAARLRNHVLSVFEQAVREPDLARRRELLTFVIIGAGPTGVELAGAFRELFAHALTRDFRGIDISEARVVLVEATNKLLASFPASLQRKARKKLEKMGVELKFEAPVASVENDCLTFKDGTQLGAKTIIWTAGVRGARLGEALNQTLERGARVVVQPTLNLESQPHAFIIGDMAHFISEKTGRPLPMVAQVAIQQGKVAARNVMASIRGEKLQVFRYLDKGQMATIGRSAAVLDSFGLRLSGFVAWLGWLFIHLIYLVGFRNRLLVLSNWIYNYLTYDRGVRIISGPEGRRDD